MSAHLRLEPSIRLVVDRLAAVGLPPFEAGTPAQARELSWKLRPVREPRQIRHVTDLWVPGPATSLKVRHYAESLSPRAAILYLHGGGWTLGSVDESDALSRELARTAASDVYSLEYRLAPEAPYPAAIKDVEATLRWLAGSTDLPIVLMGDSAGANLATVVARRARDRGEDHVAMQILVYPVTDVRMDFQSYTTFADGPLLTRSLMAWFWDQYLPKSDERESHDASPLRADLSGLPPTFVLTAENDVLRDEGKAYATALEAAGVQVTYKMYEGQIHGFLGMVGVSQGNAQAFADIASLIRDQI